MPTPPTMQRSTTLAATSSKRFTRRPSLRLPISQTFARSHRHERQRRDPPPPRRATSLPPHVAILAGIWSFFTDAPKLSPQTYTRHRITKFCVLSPTHVYIELSLTPASAALFRSRDADGRVLIQHICVKSPDIVIERPYTPLNDVAKDGKIKLVVKRVKGGEVGRYIHILKEGDSIEIRGPIPTTTVDLSDVDEMTTVTTGTGVAPILQLLSKTSGSPQKVRMLHYEPPPGALDLFSAGLPKALSPSSGVEIVRLPFGTPISAQDLPPPDRSAVMICLPVKSAFPLVGRELPRLLSLSSAQGQLAQEQLSQLRTMPEMRERVGGVLGELGYQRRHVWVL